MTNICARQQNIEWIRPVPVDSGCVILYHDERVRLITGGNPKHGPKMCTSYYNIM